MSDGVELELKYLSETAEPPELPSAWSLSTELERAEIRDTYLDVAGHIEGRGWLFRRREVVGSPARYTLKRGVRRSGALHERDEIELEASEPSEIPARILQLLEHEFGVGIARTLQPTVTLHQVRRRWALLRGGTAVAELTIDAVRSEAKTWNELEVEFLSGAEGALAMAQELQRSLDQIDGLTPSTQSKGERGRAQMT